MATTAERSQKSVQTDVIPALQDIVTETQNSSRSSASQCPLPSVMTTQLLNLTDHGPLVRLNNQTELPARTTVPLTPDLVGREVVLAFENGDASLPIIMGVIAPHPLPVAATAEETTACVDGERVVIEGRKEIVLKCGKASITLTKAGKVLIKGAYLSSRSSGVNRIRGGSVHIN